ncbi:hypothetical protein VOLCADRAFT_96645 [Volvox carteri f. nagariensis]|uniref:Uncharacterized protein n=1 Tax=Volvox carteri f. nagariensis TaxID=3068 RepID=D8UAN7_VOLCA|nr:uncharacterized protein VOLCADRAFT_96645 [Volvox carteri f. nagariensis]EFJ43137.1 hypothetical protein VOLCADRAFT_96645 [Volvox carteri f. nagariensis]|eukprot:XP_002955712.1 hypothetical protein VOLCADRAFT_96645 [Volvox carteri f. nagariensis]
MASGAVPTVPVLARGAGHPASPSLGWSFPTGALPNICCSFDQPDYSPPPPPPLPPCSSPACSADPIVSESMVLWAVVAVAAPPPSFSGGAPRAMVAVAVLPPSFSGGAPRAVVVVAVPPPLPAPPSDVMDHCQDCQDCIKYHCRSPAMVLPHPTLPICSLNSTWLLTFFTI